MSTEDARKRKACQSCTRAKAKCSPAIDSPDICYRCQRLAKECIFEDTVRRKGPKSRSRVKQLEHRVDTLIDLLAANGKSAAVSQLANGASVLPTTARKNSYPDAPDKTREINQSFAPYVTPVDTPDDTPSDAGPFHHYDPVEAGIIDEHEACSLLEEFKAGFTQSFPFVIIPPTTDANALRKSSPFLFLSIMTVTACKKPATMQVLADELRNQIAFRVIGRSRKSLEILQGLLVYGAWYHFFYTPETQQLAVVIQLCVAMVQDLELSKNAKVKARRSALAENENSITAGSGRTFAERRAFLGTYFMTVFFAQAWRKCSTMRYTRYAAQCCQLLAERQEYPSDVLITPLISICDLMCRINDHFSYDDIENADVKGEMMLEMSTVNFRNELERMRDSITKMSKENHMPLCLAVCLAEIWIYECSIHSSLWTQSSPMSLTRTKALYQCMHATKSYLKTLIAVPRDTLYQLAAPVWTSWFYSSTIACKLVFLEENERQSKTDFDSTAEALEELCSDDTKFRPHEPCSLPAESRIPSAWDPIIVAKEAEVQNLFEQMIKKMEFTAPPDDMMVCDPMQCDRMSFAFLLQRSLLHGFTKQMKEHLSRTSTSASKEIGSINTESANSSDHSIPSSASPGYLQYQSQLASAMPPDTQFTRPRLHNYIPPVIPHINSISFDGMGPLEPLAQPQGGYDAWLWDMVMDDFSAPPL